MLACADHHIRTRSGVAVRAFQNLCGADYSHRVDCNGRPFHIGVPRRPVLHIFFLVGSALGSEPFYIVGLPLLAWTLPEIFRRVLLAWLLVYFVGEALKDRLRLPRPSSPPSLRLNGDVDVTESQPGFPSTHAMGATALSLYVLLLASSAGYTPPWLPVAPLCALWGGWVALARVYLGVHSFEDVLGGAALAVVLVTALRVVDDAADAFVLARPALGALLLSALSLALIAVYPRVAGTTAAYSSTFGDIATIGGVCVGCYAGLAYAAVARALRAPDALSCPGSVAEVAQLAAHALCGLAVLVAVRSAVKPVAARVAGLGHADGEKHAGYLREGVCKVAVYSAIGFAAVVTAPALCAALFGPLPRRWSQSL